MQKVIKIYLKTYLNAIMAQANKSQPLQKLRHHKKIKILGRKHQWM